MQSEQSGRSLIEVIGVLAIAGVMTAAAVATYNTIRHRQIRTIANSDIEQIVKNTKLLLGARGDYSDVSVEYLIKAGALKNAKPPIGKDWSVRSENLGAEFSLNLTGLSYNDCAYFTTVKTDWAYKIRVNNFESEPNCLSSGDNEVSFFIQ
jgi:type II secretory pathway pseudopilin PulG